MTDRTALVTGAAGFIGSHLSERLIRNGWRVTGIDCLTGNYDRAPKRANLARLMSLPGFTFKRGAVHNLEPAALEPGFDYAFHLAGRPGVRSSYGRQLPLYIRDNVVSTQRLLAACVGGRTRRVIFASSSSVYGNCAEGPVCEEQPLSPESPYAKTKATAEAVCAQFRRRYGLEIVCLRLFTVYGPRQRPDMAVDRFVRAIHSGAPLEILGDGLQSRDMTYVDDAVEAMVLAATAPEVSEVYNIAGGQTVTVEQLVRRIEGLTGLEARIVRKDAHPGDVRRTAGDTGKARRELGYSPGVRLTEGLRRQIEEIISTTALSPQQNDKETGRIHEHKQAA